MIDNEVKEILLQMAYDEEFLIGSIEALTTAIKAFEEIEQYREIGTVEELKVLKEKSIAKKVIRLKNHDYYDYKCPTCGFSDLYCMGKRYCSCGQALEF